MSTNSGAVHFRLDDSGFKGDCSDIMSIIISFCKDLYDKTGLKLGIFMGPTESGLDTYCKDNGLEVATEEILWKNMTICERIDKFVEYIGKINGIGGELLIIDPYLFPRKSDDTYPGMLAQILNKADCKRVTVVTDKKNLDEHLLKKVRQSTKSEIDLVYSSDFHDRFWIANEEEGFVCGTSLNGVGGRISSICNLDEDDVKYIVEEVKKIM